MHLLGNSIIQDSAPILKAAVDTGGQHVSEKPLQLSQVFNLSVDDEQLRFRFHAPPFLREPSIDSQCEHLSDFS
jgi:hypothetical protein